MLFWTPVSFEMEVGNPNWKKKLSAIVHFKPIIIMAMKSFLFPLETMVLIS
jgi:hypothetical protein